MTSFSLGEHPHRRYNPLTGEWILVSPHRARRPWLGEVEAQPPEHRPAFDPTCYLCPGNERAGGVRNPAYTGTFVFDNDFPALLADTPPGSSGTGTGGLLVAEAERGICRVVCFSPRHDLTLPELDPAMLRQVVDTWAEQTEALSAPPAIRYVQVFENKGAMMGASNPHPHGQIWATEHLPNEPAKEHTYQLAYRAERGACLLCDYVAAEMAREERIVCANDHFVALVPFWAIWPFETMVASRRHTGTLPALDGAERDALADVLRRLTARYDNLFQISFPYSMGFHQQPAKADRHSEAAWHLHAHCYPPLLRSAIVRKFMVGFEMLGMPQRDLTAEMGAARLRAVGESALARRGPDGNG
jgi:UDPglucose--hexose-1-phosphate uridylyltransferase